MGTIDVDKKADMVLLNANPLEDIRNTRDIAGVATKGVFYDNESLIKLVHDFER